MQQIFEASQAKGPLTDQVYLDALATDHLVSRDQGIDAVLQNYGVDAIFAPTRNPAWTIDLINGDRSFGASSTPAALAGYPLVTVTAGNAFGELPVGVTFMGTAWSEPKLIKYAYAFEQATHAPLSGSIAWDVTSLERARFWRHPARSLSPPGRRCVTGECRPIFRNPHREEPPPPSP